MQINTVKTVQLTIQLWHKPAVFKTKRKRWFDIKNFYITITRSLRRGIYYRFFTRCRSFRMKKCTYSHFVFPRQQTRQFRRTVAHTAVVGWEGGNDYGDFHNGLLIFFKLGLVTLVYNWVVRMFACPSSSCT